VIPTADGVMILRGGRQYHVALRHHDSTDAVLEGGDGAVLAPMNGRIVAVLVTAGQRVARGARVAVMEAMKMEHSLVAPVDGTVAEVAVAAGASVAAGAAVMRIEADDPTADGA
jgi:3-methylcrotonyl-CoA carboxylase alpha subunit